MGLNSLFPLQTTINLTEAVAFQANESQENLSADSEENRKEYLAANIKQFNVKPANSMFDDSTIEV